MTYVRPTNTAPLAPEAKEGWLQQYGDFYRDLAARDPGALNRKPPEEALAGALDRIGALIVAEARTLADGNPAMRRFLDDTALPGGMSGSLPDEFRTFCLLLNGVKQWLAHEQAATDKYLLGSRARARLRRMGETCLVTGAPLTGDAELHHPMRDGRPPLPISREGLRIVEQGAGDAGEVDGEADGIAAIIAELKKPKESWRMLRRGCLLIQGLPAGEGTPAGNASAKALARRAISATELSAEGLVEWLDANGLGVMGEG